MKKLGFAVLTAVLLISLASCSEAKDSDMNQWTGTILNNSTTDSKRGNNNPSERMTINWVIPKFRMARKERMAVEVKVSGGNFRGLRPEEVTEQIRSSLIGMIMEEGPQRNISVVLGQPKRGDLVFKVEAKVVVGKGGFRSSSSSGQSDRYSRSSHESDSSDSGSRESQTVYLSLKPMIYRSGDGEILSAPAARISASESDLTGGSDSRRNSHSSSYRWKRGRYSSHSSYSNYDESWDTDGEIAKETAVDSLIQEKTWEAVCLSFQSLNKSLFIDRYNAIKDREAAEEENGDEEMMQSITVDLK